MTRWLTLFCIMNELASEVFVTQYIFEELATRHRKLNKNRYNENHDHAHGMFIFTNFIPFFTVTMSLSFRMPVAGPSCEIATILQLLL